MKKTVGISGCGFVGTAVDKGFRNSCVTKVYDPNLPPFDKQEVLLYTDFVFLCVPTPTVERLQNLDAIEDNLSFLSKDDYQGGVVIKSTTLPSNIAKLVDRFSNLNIIGNPEFLDQKTADHDFRNPRVNVIGCVDTKLALSLRNLYTAAEITPRTVFLKTPQEAMMVKYVINSFFAVKNAVMNIYHEYCGKNKMDWYDIIEAALADNRIDPVHTKVPGPDGKLGYGGACLPKDIEALARAMDRELLYAAFRTNRLFRSPDE